MKGALPRRILVALDASASSREAAAAAAELAALLGAELHGLFVEDLNLLKLSRLPFARQVGLAAGKEVPLDQQGMEAELRALAAVARELLAQSARRHHIDASFRVVRGDVTAEVLAAAAVGDLLVLGRTGRRARRGPGNTAQVAVAHARVPVLVAARSAPAGKPVLAIYDGGDEAGSALLSAARLAEKTRRQLALLLPAATESGAGSLLDAATRLLARVSALPARWPGGSGAAEVIAAARAAAPGLLVIPADSPVLAGSGLALLLDAAACPVLLTR